jgi:hypothetical protein
LVFHKVEEIDSTVIALRSVSFSVRGLVFAACLLAISLLGTGCAGYHANQLGKADMYLSATSFNFQTIVVGQKATQTIKISNTGTAVLEISGIAVSSKEFSVTGPAFPQKIAPAASAAYAVTFAPTAAGTAAATLNIASNAAVRSASVSLAGNGEKGFAGLVITPAAVSFGKLPLKTTGMQNVTLQNTGDINLSIQGVTVAGAGFGFSDLSPGFSLAPNQKLTFQIWFSPKVAGPASATLSLLSADLASPGTLSMTGDGVNTATTTTPPTTTTPSSAQHSVALTWNPSTSTVAGYRVYRSEASGSSFSVLSGTQNALAYTDSTVASGTTYYYVVTAVDSAGNESVNSNQVTAVIPGS